MKVFLNIGLLILLSFQGYSQPQISYDSLLLQLSFSMDDTARIDLLNQVAAEAIYFEPEMILKYAEEALAMSNKIDYKKGIAEAYNNIGSFLRNKGLYHEAIDYFFKSLELSESIQFREGIARSHNLFGILYFLMDNLDNAIEHYEKSFNIYEEIEDKKWIAGISNNIGMIHERKGNYLKALDYYSKSLEISLKIGNLHWLASNFNNIGSLYLSIDHPLSFYYFRRSLDIRKQMADTTRIAFSNYLIGKYYIQENKYSQAISFLEDGLNIAVKSGNLQLSKITSEQLGIAYAGIENYRNAYEFHLMFKKYSDSLDLRSSTERITRLNYIYEYLKNKQIADLEHEQSRLYRVIIVVTLGLTFIILVLLYWRQRLRVRQQKIEQRRIMIENEALEETLEFKEHLLEENIYYLIRKNELLTQVMVQLSEIKSQLKPENHSMINKLILDLQGGLQDESDEEFELRFNQIHQDFYSNLMSQFPDLSANETKLCAFLRLKMNSREISALTGQSVKSVEMARSRLRKKLNLSGKQVNLIDFLETV
jgi:tetratricopeptide (TPR) repeat protein